MPFAIWWSFLSQADNGDIGREYIRTFHIDSIQEQVSRSQKKEELSNILSHLLSLQVWLNPNVIYLILINCSFLLLNSRNHLIPFSPLFLEFSFSLGFLRNRNCASPSHGTIAVKYYVQGHSFRRNKPAF